MRGKDQIFEIKWIECTVNPNYLNDSTNTKWQPKLSVWPNSKTWAFLKDKTQSAATASLSNTVTINNRVTYWAWAQSIIFSRGFLEFPISGNWGLGCRISGAKWVDEGGTHWPLKRQEGTTSTRCSMLIGRTRRNVSSAKLIGRFWFWHKRAKMHQIISDRYIFSDYFEFCFLTGPRWCSRTSEGPVAWNLPRLEQQVGPGDLFTHKKILWDCKRILQSMVTGLKLRREKLMRP